MAEQRLIAIRDHLKTIGAYYFLVPRADRFQGEYVAPSDERLAWLTGFTGSAGWCIVGLDQAAVFVDGRYTVQAGQQVDKEFFTVQNLQQQALPTHWLTSNMQSGEKAVVDPWLITPRQARELKKACADAGGSFAFLKENLIDLLWNDRPPEPSSPVCLQTPEFSGRSCTEKLADVRRTMSENGAGAKIVSDPTCVAWLFNIRARDLTFTPVPLAYAAVTGNNATLFIDKGRFAPDVLTALPEDVTCRSPAGLTAVIQQFSGENVEIDAATVPEKIRRLIKAAGATPVEKTEPISLWKACKNDVEVLGMRKAHIRDGIAICRFVHWLKTTPVAGVVNEYEAAKRLENFRKDLKNSMGPSFVPISAVGPNSALCHYQPSATKSEILQSGDIYLLDSGGQYLDGTTDFTRTFVIGERPDEEQRIRYTMVLKAHIALADIRFPLGTTGQALDAIARVPLWHKGMDFDHGTGHGVGSYLSVHEGPQRIAKFGSDIPLAAGMTVSIEPGHYVEGEYGIRIENLVEIIDDTKDSDNCVFLAFRALTLAPVEMSLVDEKLLDKREKNWINSYNKRLLGTLAPHLESDVRDYFYGALKEILL
jgi:Xaa-Pro aminopeptidase